MKSRRLQAAFSGGELSPHMFGRVDMRDYANGVALMRNMIARATGNAQSRPGLRHVADAYAGVDTPVRLIDWVYTPGDSYAVEIGSEPVDGSTGYIRFHRNNQPVRWADVLELGAVNGGAFASDGTITLAERHELVQSEPVYFLADNPANLPGGLAATTVYYVLNVDGRRFQVSTTPGGAAVAMTIGASNTELVRIVPTGDMTAYPGSGNLQAGSVYWAVSATRCGAVHSIDGGPRQADPFADSRATTQPNDGILTIAAPPYAADDIFRLNYTQSFDVLTFARNGFRPYELRRLGALRWQVVEVDFSIPSPPTLQAPTINRGGAVNLEQNRNRNPGNNIVLRTVSRHDLGAGDVVYLDDVRLALSGGGEQTIPDGYYTVQIGGFNVSAGGGQDVSIDFVPRDFDTGAFLTVGGTALQGAATGSVRYTDLASELDHEYVATTVFEDDAESPPSAVVTATDVSLAVSGASITLTWTAVPNAVRYRIYKRGLVGLMGFIGETEDTSFVDQNQQPDLEASPPEFDPNVDVATFDPQAVAHFEQRRVFAAPSDLPARMFLTNSATEDQFTFTIPVRDDNRIALELRSLQGQQIRHIIPFGELLAFTNSSEWRITSVGSQAVTPSTVAARQQSNNGASYVVPLAINDTVVYAAERGGHIRELRFAFQQQSFTGSDLSVRAQHLFDDYQVLDMARMQSPLSMLWSVSSQGRLIGTTYMPEEQFVAHHQHVTEGGTFESVACIPESAEDGCYLVVNRGTRKAIESMRVRTQLRPELQPCADAHATTVDTEFQHRVGERARVTGTLTAGQTVLLETRGESGLSGRNALAPEDVGELVVLRSDGIEYRVRIDEYVSNNTARALVLDPMPQELSGVSLEWQLGRSSLAVPVGDGTVLSVVADGVDTTATVEGGRIACTSAVRVTAGLPFTPELHTLPLSMQAEAAGRGRTVNIESVWLRMFEAFGGCVVGHSEDSLVPVENLERDGDPAIPEQSQDVYRTTVLGNWNEDGALVIQQTRPFPLTVLQLVILAAFGD